MRTTFALILKFIATLLASWIAFDLIDENPFNWVLVIALAGSLLNYFVGYLLIMKSMGKVIESIGDGILGAFTAYVVDFLVVDFISSVTGLIVFALVIMLVEYVFHIYLYKGEIDTHNEFHKDIPLE
ncbi:MAG: hypothetical protein K0Q97_2570 [Bacillota bacterium]|jgi:biotin transporter BioY|nr:hypothetical protein [Bacillota bacterium]